MKRPAGLAVALVLLALVLAGCKVGGRDDEVDAPRPRSTTTVTSGPTTAPVPASVPIGGADVLESSPVWAQGSVLHVGNRGVDLSPHEVDTMVVVTGGVYFLDGQRLWFTDLRRIRDTGVDHATSLRSTADGEAIQVVSSPPGQPAAVLGYDTRSGARIPGRGLDVVTATQRLGRAGRVEVSGRPLAVRQSPGGYAVTAGADEPFTALRTDGSTRLKLRGDVPTSFALGAWTDPTTVIGVARDGTGDSARSVVLCALATGSCDRLGPLFGDAAPVFATGT